MWGMFLSLVKSSTEREGSFLHLSSFLLLKKLFFEVVILHTAGSIRTGMVKTLKNKERERPLFFDDIIKPLTQLWS